MQYRTAVALCSMGLTLGGCDYRMMDPHWNSLAKKGVSYAPGDYDSAVYTLGVTDEQFAAAVPDFKRVKIRKLNFQETQLTDRSIDGLLQLRSLEHLELQREDFTADGLARLAGLPRLKILYVPRGQFTEEELGRLRAAMPKTHIEESRLGSERYRSASPTTGPRGSDAP